MKIVLFFTLLSILLFGFACSRTKKKDYSEIINLFEAHTYTTPEIDTTLLYRLYIPPQQREKQKLPLILYLTSSGPRGNDNRSQIEYGAREIVAPAVQEKHPSFILVPQCPENRQWVNTVCRTFPLQNYDQDSIPESNEMKLIIKLIRKLARDHPIDPNRIYVTGISMGGSGTWDIITRHPEFFAAAAPLNGVSDPSKAHLIADLPIWAFHGRQDNVSDVNNTRKMIASLKNNGSSCQYTEYPDAGHGIAGPTYANTQLFDWMFAQLRKE